MDGKSRGIPLTTVLLSLFLSAIFSTSFSETKKPRPLNSAMFSASSVVFQIQGNVYPLGYYTVNVAIGNPPKIYDLDIDSGSDLTWVQCDAPCTGCTIPRDRQYKPHGNIVKCGDPLCAAIQSASNHPCTDPNGQCDYEVEYADLGSSLGVLVEDNIPLKLTNGSLASPTLAFGSPRSMNVVFKRIGVAIQKGMTAQLVARLPSYILCGYDQTHHGNIPPPSTAGVLGLGNGKTSILSQLNSLGLIRNVVGHCLSRRGGGFLFFGDIIPQSGVDWTPILQTSPSSSVKHYKTGLAILYFNGMPAYPVQTLELIFDSGSSYTYFNSQTHKALVDLITNDLQGKPLTRATEDRSLPICFKGPKPFTSINDVTNYFKPLSLVFQNSMGSTGIVVLPQLQLPPEAYLIVTTHGNVCLGILNGTEIGLGNTNIIGDISLQDKIVIYDNEKQQVGWTKPVNCDTIFKS